MQAIEIAIQYDTLLNTGVTHTFFGDEKPNIFSWQPSTETVRLLNQMGILIRYTTDSVLLLASSAEEEAMRKKIQENPSFTISFALYAENSYFKHFSQMPLEQKGKCFYFQNTKSNFLHTTEFASEADILPYLVGKAVVGEQKKESILNLAHSYLPTQEDITTDEQGNAIAYLSALPFGKYTFASKTKTEATFLHISPIASKTLVGWVDIFIDEKTSAEWVQGISTSQKIKTKSYQIKFEARKTFWKYYFISKYLPNLDNTEIESTGNNIQFEKPQEVVLPNGMKATCFETKQALPIKKKSNLSMQLVRKKDAKGNNIRQVLCKVPAPNFEGLRAESRQTDAKIFSEVIIYV